MSDIDEGFDILRWSGPDGIELGVRFAAHARGDVRLMHSRWPARRTVTPLNWWERWRGITLAQKVERAEGQLRAWAHREAARRREWQESCAALGIREPEPPQPVG